LDNRPIPERFERSIAMKASMVTMVGLLVVICAFWNGEAEAQRGGGKVPPARAPKVAGAGGGKVHPQQPKVKANHKAKVAAPKEAHKKQKGSPHEQPKMKKGGEHEKQQKGKAAVRGPLGEVKSKALEEPTEVGKAVPGTSPSPGVPAVRKQ
jgi:hypothetical protein